MRSASRFLADESGASLVEFALVAPFFFGFLLLILQAGLLEAASVNFNNSLLAASREIRVGAPAASAEKFKERVCDGMVRLGAKCEQRLTVSVAAIDSFAAAAAVAAQPLDRSKDSFDRGSAGQIMLVTATYRWPLWAPFVGSPFPRDGSDVLLTSRLIFKNEPYDQAGGSGA